MKNYCLDYAPYICKVAKDLNKTVDEDDALPKEEGSDDDKGMLRVWPLTPSDPWTFQTSAMATIGVHITVPVIRSSIGRCLGTRLGLAVSPKVPIWSPSTPGPKSIISTITWYVTLLPWGLGGVGSMAPPRGRAYGGLWISRTRRPWGRPKDPRLQGPKWVLAGHVIWHPTLPDF